MSIFPKYSNCCDFYIECHLAGSLNKCFQKRKAYRCKNFYKQKSNKIEHWRDSFVECSELKIILQQGLVD